MLPAIIGCVLVFLWVLYKWYVSAYNYWESKGIKAEPGRFPFGNDINLVTLKEFQGRIIDKMYRKYKTEQYFGYYVMRTPILVVRDPEIIRLVMAKEFSHFRDRHGIKMASNDPLQHHLFNLDGERWRALRVKLSPTFTSGKLKAMFPLFVKCCEDLTNLLISLSYKTLDVKDVTARYTTDTICSCAFGLENNSIFESNNELRNLGVRIMTKSVKNIARAAVLKTFPGIEDFVDFKITSRRIEDSIMKIVGDTIEYREKNGVIRNDFLGLLIEMKNKGTVGEELKTEETGVQPVEINLDMMAAQSFVFFIAGFETSSSVQSYCLYELALNPEVQKKVCEEIDRVIEKHGSATYQAVQEMEYLDMCVSETMRMHPTLPSLTRSCTRPFTMPGGHKILKGDRVLIPLWALHRDPKYFPNPNTFDPERFSAANKENIKPYTYMPFGEGPRICIGMRFGLVQTKMGLITVLRKFQVQKTDETEIPLKFTGSSTIAMTKGPIKLKLVPRSPSH